MSSANFEDQTARLRALASGEARVFCSEHGFKEMANDQIARLDVEEMLCDCTVTRIDESQGEESWRAEGEDFDGRHIVAIIVPYEGAKPPYIKIVTCWVKK